ncbi:unnamed protein product [Durusdinium trenchii]|uniref:Uncharacterized protein n=2 Tax=Durusdinium trenchii TaxID=1381693 RepID=A0ABP0K7D1_9DINO
MMPGAFQLSSSSAGVKAGHCHGIPLPQIIYERPKRTARCFSDVEEFLQNKEVSCRRVCVERTFMHIHQDEGPAKKKRRKKESEEGTVEKVPAWEEYLRANGFTNCQLVQTFLWRAAEELIFACAPYPWRPDAALLAEVLQRPAEELARCNLKQVRSITKKPLFICLPFALPEGSVLVADEGLCAETKELLFDCGTVALFMSTAEFLRSTKPVRGPATLQRALRVENG